ncbi:MAG: flagellar hook protein FlgE [Myxococcota bacterium]
MSILRSMYSASSGLQAHGKAMDVVSDNIANVNTIGFKAGRGRFEDVLGKAIGEVPAAGLSGNGSMLAGVDQLFGQGALLGTGVSTDMAIQGDGFFMVEGNFQGVDGRFFSRAGQFNLDERGFLVNPQGLRVQGYLADPSGTIGSQVTDITVPPTFTVPPRVTANVNVAANLDSSAVVPPAFDPTNAQATSNFSTSVTVHDSLGEGHNVDMFFRNAGGGTWEWYATVDGARITGGTAGTPEVEASGTLQFTTDGALDVETTAASSFDFINATAAQAITFDFGDAITTDAGTGLTGLTNYASPSSVVQLEQDGYSSGALAGIVVDQDGLVTGTFTNGERRALAQVAVARFQNNQGLLRSGAGLYSRSEDSGLELVGQAGTGGRGSVVGQSLEQSNVDLAREFVDMINFQRGFQANSRTIRTADELLTEVVNLKR